MGFWFKNRVNHGDTQHRKNVSRFIVNFVLPCCRVAFSLFKHFQYGIGRLFFGQFGGGHRFSVNIPEYLAAFTGQKIGCLRFDAFGRTCCRVAASAMMAREMALSSLFSGSPDSAVDAIGKCWVAATNSRCRSRRAQCARPSRKL
jgi:hypothetical protein